MIENLKPAAFAASAAVLLALGSSAAVTIMTTDAVPTSKQTISSLLAKKCAPNRVVTDDDLTVALQCADLEAQSSMARSTSGLYALAWLQLVVSIGGTALLLISLRETRKATKLTRRAVESQVEATRLNQQALEQQAKALDHQQEIDKTTLRARINSMIYVEPATETTLKRLRMDFINNGQTTARKVQAIYLTKVVDGLSDESALEELPREFGPKGALSNGATTWTSRGFTDAQYAAFERKTKCVHVAMFMIYEDEFGRLFKSSRVERRFGRNLNSSVPLKNCKLPVEFEGRKI